MKEKKPPLTKIEKKAETWRIVKFVLFSISAGAIQIISFSLLELIPYCKYNYWLPATISLILSVLWNFTFNRRFTFQSANNVPIAMLKTLAYYVVFGPLSIAFGHMYLVVTLKWNDFLVEGVLMLVNLITEFLYQRYFVFNKSLDTNDLAKKKIEQTEKTHE